MNKILVGGAGGAPSEGVINSLSASKTQELIVGMGSELTDLILSKAAVALPKKPPMLLFPFLSTLTFLPL